MTRVPAAIDPRRDAPDLPAQPRGRRARLGVKAQGGATEERPPSVLTQMARAYRTAIHGGRKPVHFALNPQAYTKLQQELNRGEEIFPFMGVEVKVIRNKQTEPSVCLKCEGDLR